MVEKVKLNPFPYTHDKNSRIRPVNGHSHIAAGTSNKELRKALAERIENDVPKRLLEMRPIRKGFVPTEIQKRMVWRMAAMGASWQIIRLAVFDPETSEPISEPTLDFHFREIMKHAREQANFTVALKIYELAVGQDAEYDEHGNLIKPYKEPNLDACRYWDRSRGEGKQILQFNNSSGKQIEGTSVTLVIEGS